MQLKDRLAELRRERGLTLRELRARIRERTGTQLSISYLSELERVEATPSLAILTRIARGYDLALRDLLAPVDVYGADLAGDPSEGSLAQYPQSLQQFAAEEGLAPDSPWLQTLSRIEFRGQRPQTVAQWRAIYGVLQALMAPEEGGA